MKLRARITMMTGTEAARSHGEMASAWMFWACWRSTPQLMAGGRRPSPRKDSEVSLMIMAGVGGGGGGVVWVGEEGDKGVGVVGGAGEPARPAAPPKISPPRGGKRPPP